MYILYALLALVFWSFWGFFSDLSKQFLPVRTALFSVMIGKIIVGAGIYFLFNIQADIFTKQPALAALGAGVCAAFGTLFLLHAFEHIAPGVALAISGLYPILVIIGGIVAFAQYVTLKEGIGVGVALVALGCFYTPPSLAFWETTEETTDE